MIHVFESSKELFEKMKKDKESADVAVKPWQDALKTGDFCVRSVDYNNGLIVIFTELIDSSYKEDRDRYKQPQLKNYRFGRHFSVMCPEGELGDVHVAAVDSSITKEMFEEARDGDFSMGVIQGWMARGWAPDFKKNQ